MHDASYTDVTIHQELAGEHLKKLKDQRGLAGLAGLDGSAG